MAAARSARTGKLSKSGKVLDKPDTKRFRVAGADVLCGKAARARGLVTERQLLECLDLQVLMKRRLGRHAPIGEIMVMRGLVTVEQLRVVLGDVNASLDPSGGAAGRDLFGRLAIQQGHCTAEHVLRCLDIQAAEVRAGKRRRALGEIMISEGYLGVRQVEELLRLQKKAGRA